MVVTVVVSGTVFCILQRDKSLLTRYALIERPRESEWQLSGDVGCRKRRNSQTGRVGCAETVFEANSLPELLYKYGTGDYACCLFLSSNRCLFENRQPVWFDS